MKAQAVLFDDPVGYKQAVEMQEQLHAARLGDNVADTILCMRHKPVITLGRRGRDNYLAVSPQEIAERGIDYCVSSRGGDVTCHGRGQWVLYPIMKLCGEAASARGHLWNLEEIAVRTAADFGVEAFRRAGMNGAWTDAGKIAAIGFHIKRWVTLHGMSFNACGTPSGFELIVPCGLKGEPVAALKSVLGASCPSMKTVGRSLLRNFGKVCDREIEMVAARELPLDL